MKPLTLAIAKGYLLSEALRLLEKLGVRFEDDLTTSRKLFTWDTEHRLRILQVRPWDVPVYVEQGAADIGIVGLDVLNEQQPKVLNLLDLKFGVCHLVLAGPKPSSEQVLTHNLKVATKYPNATSQYFLKKGLNVELLKLYGAIELGPLTGLSDLICDLTATGTTLKENHLHIVDTLFSSSAYLIANPVSFKAEYEAIINYVERLKEVL
jgi:ATP phosphoribosyltransferase